MRTLIAAALGFFVGFYLCAEIDDSALAKARERIAALSAEVKP